jgi:hypothetical protein
MNHILPCFHYNTPVNRNVKGNKKTAPQAVETYGAQEELGQTFLIETRILLTIYPQGQPGSLIPSETFALVHDLPGQAGYLYGGVV